MLRGQIPNDVQNPPYLQLELIAADDGCNISWLGIINLINNLYYADHKQIVGIVGPRCSDSTKAVASLTRHPEIALLNVHLGSAPELANRTLYPYKYGIRPPTSVDVDAVVALFSYNKWTRAAVLYNPDMLVDYNSFVLSQNKIMGIANLSFVSPASLKYLPLDELRNSYVRVIVSFLRDETLQRVLCLTYYKNITNPGYQWILFEPNNDSNVSFVYQGEQYECSGEQLVITQNQSISVSDYNTVIGFYTFPDGVLEVSSSIAVFVSTNFEEKLILVSTPLAVVVIIVEAVAAVLVIWVHILNTMYRHRKTIKTSSARLNHFAYVGCYVILSETDVPYGILCFALMIIVYLCVFLLFIPPVLPVMKEWLAVNKNCLACGIEVGSCGIIWGGAHHHKVLAQVAYDSRLADLKGDLGKGEEPLDLWPPPDALEYGQAQAGSSATPLFG
eukprot:Em0007g1510a